MTRNRPSLLIGGLFVAIILFAVSMGWIPGFGSGDSKKVNVMSGIDAVPCADARDVANALAITTAKPPSPERDKELAEFGFAHPAQQANLVEERQAQLDKMATLNAEGKCVNGVAPVAAPKTTEPSSPGTGTSNGPCPKAYVQKFDPNRKGNVDSNGVDNSQEVLVNYRRDARALAGAAHVLGLWPNTNAKKLLTPDNKCLSREGQDLYQQVKGATSGKGVKIDQNGTAPANYYNTGMQNGRLVVDSRPGIGGDRSAIVYTLRNGTRLIVLKRCANFALPRPDKLPKGPTDHQRPPGKRFTPPPPNGTGGPPPKTPPQTTPPTKCPPGTMPPKCLQPKDKAEGPVAGSNIPTQVQRRNPPAARSPEPRPAQPPNTYTPPPPPPPPAPTRTRSTPPPPPPPAPEPTEVFDPCNPVTPACG